jgi:hypothetical protein
MQQGTVDSLDSRLLFGLVEMKRDDVARTIGRDDGHGVDCFEAMSRDNHLDVKLTCGTPQPLEDLPQQADVNAGLELIDQENATTF